MKTTVKLAVIGTLLALGCGTLKAQSNVVQTLTVNLTGVQQTGDGTTSPAKITNKEIITALSGGSGTNGTFSSRARLMTVTPIEGGTTSVIVRDIVGHGNVDTDVSGNFSMNTAATVTKALVAGTGTDYSIQTFSFSSGSVAFNVQGYSTASEKTGTLTSSVNGSGTTALGNSAVFRGTVTASAGKKE
jgi:hypothetical protein